MKKIKLTKNKYTLVDDSDFEWLSQWKWHFSTSGHKSGNGYAARGDYSTSQLVYMHRLILNLVDKELVTDHINGRGLDNRRCNLRAVTKAQNYIGRAKRYNSTNRYKGVRRNSGSKTWNAIISFRGKSYYLGSFKTELGARRVYLKAAKMYHGEFAR